MSATIATRAPFTTARRILSRFTNAIRAIGTAPAPTTPDVTERTDTTSATAVQEIEAAAASYAEAADMARLGDRGKRAARKVLDHIPAGRYGAWLISWTPSNRSTADLDEIRRIFRAHGLGPVPMKTSAPSLKVERAMPYRGGPELDLYSEDEYRREQADHD